MTYQRKGKSAFVVIWAKLELYVHPYKMPKLKLKTKSKKQKAEYINYLLNNPNCFIRYGIAFSKQTPYLFSSSALWVKLMHL